MGGVRKTPKRYAEIAGAFPVGGSTTNSPPGRADHVQPSSRDFARIQSGEPACVGTWHGAADKNVCATS